MRSLDDTQTLLRLWGRNSTELITSGTGLDLTNAVYRRVSIGLPWSELREPANIKGDSVAGTGTYNWNFDTAGETVKFLDVKLVEIQDGSDLDTYKAIYTPPGETAWSSAQSKPRQAVPSYYMRSYSKPDNQIEFRGTPLFDGKTIRITGIREPESFTAEDDESYFQLDAADDAFVYMLAAEFNEIDGASGFADRQLGKALQLFQGIFGPEIATPELIHTIARGQ